MYVKVYLLFEKIYYNVLNNDTYNTVMFIRNVTVSEP